MYDHVFEVVPADVAMFYVAARYAIYDGPEIIGPDTLKNEGRIVNDGV